VIDLHLHSSASDGLLAPPDLIDRVAAAGICTCSVTDHDTVAGLEEAAAAAAARGLRFLSGIEITAVADGRDVHMLGYGFDPASPQLAMFLSGQRAERRQRVRRLIGRLAELGMPVDETQVVSASEDEARAHAGRVLGRPHVARAMVAAGYVASVNEAFERWLGSGRPAFVSRAGAPPAEVVAIIHHAGGLAAIAHPGLTNRDGLIPGLIDAGVDALEVWHSEHDEEHTRRYHRLALEHGLLMTGGSDYHGDVTGRVCRLGEIGVPDEAFDALVERLANRALSRAGASDAGGSR
jgi:predicted metal-dependent phosphoesterase TrpH